MLLRHWRRNHIWVALRNHLSRGRAICSMLLLINKYLRSALRRPFNIICYLPLHWPTVLGLGDEIAYCLEYFQGQEDRTALSGLFCGAIVASKVSRKWDHAAISNCRPDQTSTLVHHCDSLVVHLCGSVAVWLPGPWWPVRVARARFYLCKEACLFHWPVGPSCAEFMFVWLQHTCPNHQLPITINMRSCLFLWMGLVAHALIVHANTEEEQERMFNN
jgi:hypothetical protein